MMIPFEAKDDSFASFNLEILFMLVILLLQLFIIPILMLRIGLNLLQSFAEARFIEISTSF